MLESNKVSRVFKRQLGSKILAQIKNFKVILITGPRQSGKTTLLKELFPQYEYHTLDAIDVRERVRKDPRSIINSSQPKIIDEIQEAPELLTYIKEQVDQHPEMGQFILTGSHQFHLMKYVSESLAGRVAILNLLPFSIAELKESGIFQENLAQTILRGFYPSVVKNFDPLLGKQDGEFLTLWFDSYINTYLERDLRTQLAIKDWRSFETFLKLIASRNVKNLEKWTQISESKEKVAFVISNSKKPALSSKYQHLQWQDTAEIDGMVRRLTAVLKGLSTG